MKIFDICIKVFRLLQYKSMLRLKYVVSKSILGHFNVNVCCDQLDVNVYFDLVSTALHAQYLPHNGELSLLK